MPLYSVKVIKIATTILGEQSKYMELELSQLGSNLFYDGSTKPIKLIVFKEGIRDRVYQDILDLLPGEDVENYFIPTRQFAISGDLVIDTFQFTTEKEMSIPITHLSQKVTNPFTQEEHKAIQRKMDNGITFDSELNTIIKWLCKVEGTYRSGAKLKGYFHIELTQPLFSKVDCLERNGCTITKVKFIPLTPREYELHSI